MYNKLFTGLGMVILAVAVLMAKDEAFDRVINVTLINRPALDEIKPPLKEKEIEYLKIEVSRYFAQAGVEVRYHDEPGSKNLRVNFTSKPLVVCQTEKIEDMPFGCALVNEQTRKGIISYIDVPGINDIETAKGLPGGRIIARAIVHELCHLLGISERSGKKSGIMTVDSNWLDPKKFISLAPAEVAFIRTALASED